MIGERRGRECGGIGGGVFFERVGREGEKVGREN